MTMNFPIKPVLATLLALGLFIGRAGAAVPSAPMFRDGKSTPSAFCNRSR